MKKNQSKSAPAEKPGEASGSSQLKPSVRKEQIAQKGSRRKESQA
jgi:hypothetical protein